RLVPVALEDVVRARADLALVVHAHADADRGHAGTAETPRALRGVEPVPLRRRAIEGEQRRRLREPVDLDELPAELRLDALDRLRRRRRARDDDTHAAAARHRPAFLTARGGG